MNSNEIEQVQPPNDVDAHVMVPTPPEKSLPQDAKRFFIGDNREDDVEAHVLPVDLAGVQPPRDLDIER